MVREENHPIVPTIGITMGDPLGIGPEIVVRALADLEHLGDAKFVIYGSNERLSLIHI